MEEKRYSSTVLNLITRWRCQLHAPAALPRGEMLPVAHFIGDWVSPRAGLDVTGNRKVTSRYRESNPDLSTWSLRCSKWREGGAWSKLDGRNELETCNGIWWGRKRTAQCSDACPISNWLASGAKFVPWPLYLRNVASRRSLATQSMPEASKNISGSRVYLDAVWRHDSRLVLLLSSVAAGADITKRRVGL
jgi:hypothetical protein